MNTDTLQAIVNMIEAASTDANRPHLNTVRIEGTKTGARLVACDGHILAEREVSDEDLAKVLNSDIVYADRELKTALRAIIKAYKHGSVEIKAASYGFEISGGVTSVRFTKESKDFYPDYAAVRAKVGTPVFEGKSRNDIAEISFNPELLLALHTALSEDKRHSRVIIRFDRTKPMSPIAVEVNGGIGTLMPMRK